MKYILLSAALVGADQWLKVWASAHLELRGEWLPLLGQMLGLRLTHNYGAAWSSFSGQRLLLLARADRYGHRHVVSEPDAAVSDGDVISCRKTPGCKGGKFIIDSTGERSAKGRIRLEARRYL